MEENPQQPSTPVSEAVTPATPGSGAVKLGDLAVLGGFSGIRNYVLCPTPAAGAAGRLRSRSFRVNAFAHLMVRRVQELAPGLREVYTAGGRFLLAGPATSEAENALAAYQAELDQWALVRQGGRGEMMCHLVSARCESERLPMDFLEQKLVLRRRRPLEGALLRGGRWNPEAFRSSVKGEQKCPHCGATSVLVEEEGARMCEACRDDALLGQRLPHSPYGRLVPLAEAEVSVPRCGITLADSGEFDFDSGEWPLLRYMPRNRLPHDGHDKSLDFEDLAEMASGRRKLLGYLAADVDQAGKAFAECEGDLDRIRILSQELQDFFAAHAQNLIRTEFPTLYPIYGGGDDLLLAGPWDQTLRFALKLREDFRNRNNGRMTFSAALTAAHPRTNMRAAARQTQEALQEAKQAGGDRIRLLETTLTWEDAASLGHQAFHLARWLEQGKISSAVLDRIAELHLMSKIGQDGWRLRYLPLLAYQARDIKDAQVKEWIQRLGGSREWLWMDLLSGLAFLAAREKRKSG